MIKVKTNPMKYKDSNGNMIDVGGVIGKEVTDLTLTKSNVPADSKTVGDKLNELSEEIINQDERISEAVNIEFENEKGNLVQLLIAELQGLPVFGVVDENNTITVTSQLSAGTYTLMYENGDGTLSEIGTITVEEYESDTEEAPDTTLIWEIGTKIDSSTGAETTGNTMYSASNYIEIVDGYIYTLEKATARSEACKVVYYDADKNFISTSANVIAQTTETLSTEIPLIDGAYYFRIRHYGTASQLASGDYILTAEKQTVSYTNQIPLSVASDGSDYVGANGEDGYSAGYRVNSSGEEVAQSGMCCTGFIPTVKDQTIRLKNITVNGASTAYLVEYGQDKTYKQVTALTTSLPDDGSGVYTGLAPLTGFIRISCGVIDDTSILTLDEEIPDSDSATTNYVTTSTDTDGSIYNGTGYKDNTYISSSSGLPSDTTGFVTTGFMELPLTFYVSGATWDAASSYCRLFAYDESHTQLGYVIANSNGGKAVMTTDFGDGVTKFEILTDNIAWTTTYKYIRMCFSGTGENLVISDEEIS